MLLNFRFRTALLAATLLTLSACGIQNSNQNSSGILEGIIGGQPVAPNDPMAKGIVALYDVQAKALCTASIASPTYLITAAHCVTPGKTANLRVIFGTDLTQKAGIVSVAAVAAVAQSPIWKTNQNNPKETGDIAIVRLAAPIPQGFLPSTILRDASLIQNNAAVLLEGYGITTGHPDPKSPNDSGAGVLREVVTSIVDAHFDPSEVLIDNSKGKGACHGDSGGPAYVKDPQGNVFLFGVTSRGTDKFCSQGVIYTNILAYLTWITGAVPQLEAQVRAAVGVMMPHLAFGFDFNNPM